MGDSTPVDKTAGAKDEGVERAGRERDRRLGLYIVEVARATHEGALPISQTAVRKALKKNVRLDLAPSASTAITNVLKHEYHNKIWLRVDGHKVTLYSEEETLVDFRAVRAVLLAVEMLNDDGVIALQDWKAACRSELKVSEDSFDEFLPDIIKCRYADAPNKDDMVKLDVRAIGEDRFYLEQAAKANIKKSVARTRSGKP